MPLRPSVLSVVHVSDVLCTTNCCKCSCHAFLSARCRSECAVLAGDFTGCCEMGAALSAIKMLHGGGLR